MIEKQEVTSTYIIIREAMMDDLDAIICEAMMNDLDAIIEIDIKASAMEKHEYWRETLELYLKQNNRRCFLVAEQDNHIIGFILGEIRAWEFGSASCGWVFAIGVTEQGRLQGVGSKMLDNLCGYFRRAGVRKVRTMVVRQNHELLSFFRSQGMMAGPYQELEK